MNMRNILTQVRAAISRRYGTLPANESYVGWIRRFLFFNNRKHPAIMGEAEIELFLSHLKNNCKVSGAALSQATSAIIFLYREILGLEIRLELAG